EARGLSRLGYPSIQAEFEAKAAAITSGHPVFFQALAELLEAEHTVVILPGNHDHETQLAPVRQRLRGAVATRLSTAADRPEVLDRLIFRSWFYYAPGLLWVEHGHQYDAYNSFRSLLKPVLPPTPCTCHEDEVDFPFGSYFQRYLYNRFGAVTFVVPGLRSSAQYFLWLLVNRPSVIFKAAFWHAPLFVKMARRCLRGHEDWESGIEQRHRAELEGLAKESGLSERLKEIDGLKIVAGRAQLMVERLLKRSATWALSGVALISALLWVWWFGTRWIDRAEIPLWLQPFLFVLLTLTLFASIVGLIVYWAFRAMKKRRPTPYRQAAARIAALTGARYVVFGHSHMEDIWPVPGTLSWYFNTGTWITTFMAFRLEPRERIQFTYLEILNGKGRLMVWSPDVERPKPAVLLEEE
ncbi:MAG: hypothetical protein HYY13_11275, partial [Nitrospirae bacterium]|nr:hypothetical protein [Nitrospirota bacterium]